MNPTIISFGGRKKLQQDERIITLSNGEIILCAIQTRSGYVLLSTGNKSAVRVLATRARRMFLQKEFESQRSNARTLLMRGSALKPKILLRRRTFVFTSYQMSKETHARTVRLEW